MHTCNIVLFLILVEQSESTTQVAGEYSKLNDGACEDNIICLRFSELFIKFKEHLTFYASKFVTIFHQTAFWLKMYVFPFQEIDCGLPEPVLNAVKTGPSGGTRAHAIVIWTCNACYEGGGPVVCQSNGQWSVSPTCTCKYLLATP